MIHLYFHSFPYSAVMDVNSYGGVDDARITHRDDAAGAVTLRAWIEQLEQADDGRHN